MPEKIDHPTDDCLELYAMSRLRGMQVDNLEEHLLVCDGCQIRLDQTEIYVHAMMRALDDLRHAPARGSMWDRLRDGISGLRLPTVPAFAGALAVLALVLGISTQFRRPTTATVSDEPITVRLEAMKGDSENAVADHPLRLVLDGRGLPPAARYRMQIVDRLGRGVWAGAAESHEELLRASVPKALGSGAYFVRVFGDGEEPLREYGLRVR